MPNKHGKEFSAIRKKVMNFRITMHGIENFIIKLGPVTSERDERARKATENIKKKIRALLINIPVSGKGDEKAQERVKVKQKRISSAVNEIISLVKDYDYAGINVALDEGLHTNLLLKSSFMMMIASLDFLLSDILHCYFDKYPQALNDEMMLSLGDLNECTDINEAIQILIDQKVEAVLFKNFRK